MANFFDSLGPVVNNSVVITFLVIIFTLIALYILLVVRRNLRLTFHAIEHVLVGSNKTQKNIWKAGYFGRKSFFGGLLWSGSEVLKLSNGKIIYGWSTTDFNIINGRKGIECARVPLNEKLLAPIQSSKIGFVYKNEKGVKKEIDFQDILKEPNMIIAFNKIHLNNMGYIADLPTGDMTDSIVNVIEDTAKEIGLWKNNVFQTIVIGVIALVLLFGFFLNNQRASELDKKSTQIGLDLNSNTFTTCKNLCREAVAGVLVAENNQPKAP